MNDKERELLREEIYELTELFYNEWDDLRNALHKVNIKIDNGRLVAFCEDEYSNECGVFITSNNEIIQFEINNESDKIQTKIITNIEEASKDFPQLVIALED
ncbi:hypothetical protein [Flavobacterium sp.]|uniref:hypothetical protein n=1 Tax=Flavobacterium sp. TaxID=239 RepID=UPI0031DC1E8D